MDLLLFPIRAVRALRAERKSGISIGYWRAIRGCWPYHQTVVPAPDAMRLWGRTRYGPRGLTLEEEIADDKVYD